MLLFSKSYALIDLYSIKETTPNYKHIYSNSVSAVPCLSFSFTLHAYSCATYWGTVVNFYKCIIPLPLSIHGLH